jgi:hypothetical protein
MRPKKRDGDNIASRLIAITARILQALRLITAPVEDWESYAQNLKETAQTYGLKNHLPVILNESENCPSCRKPTLLLMQPHQICGECWLARLDATIKRDLK